MQPVMMVAGARPNFMKIAPLYAALQELQLPQFLVHTGQHYDPSMSRIFFDDLNIPEPDFYMGIGSGSHAVQTAGIMTACEKLCQDHEPSMAVVVGDVNSTVAVALTAAKMHIPVAHVEAGLRSFDRTMPEEINRLVTDCLSDLLFTPSRDGNENLLAEGKDPDRIHFVGNIMIDTLLQQLDRAQNAVIIDTLGLIPGNYALLTLHRPSNVDDPDRFASVVDALEIIAESVPVVFPMHPRTMKRSRSTGLYQRMKSNGRLILTEPLGYLDFLKVMSESHFVLTDSGGLQEETTALGIPCLTLRENTERPVTIRQGTNTLVGSDTETIVEAARQILDGKGKSGRIPELWDGRTARRIAQIIAAELKV